MRDARPTAGVPWGQQPGSGPNSTAIAATKRCQCSNGSAESRLQISLGLASARGWGGLHAPALALHALAGGIKGAVLARKGLPNVRLLATGDHDPGLLRVLHSPRHHAAGQRRAAGKPLMPKRHQGAMAGSAKQHLCRRLVSGPMLKALA